MPLVALASYFLMAALPLTQDDESKRQVAPEVLASYRRDLGLGEPLGFLRVTEDGFARAAAAISALRLPTAIIQEGGYNVDLLGRLLERFLGAWRA